MTRRIMILLYHAPLVAITLAASPVAAIGQVNPSTLERGTVAQRDEVLLELLKAPPTHWSPQVWSAVRREATRSLERYHDPKMTHEQREEYTEISSIWTTHSVSRRIRLTFPC